MLNYFRNLSNPKLVLWCYFLWYAVVVYHYFDLTPGIWLNSLGLSLFVGFALYLNTISGNANRGKADLWQTVRCFLTPFCVSSFAALVKEKGFFLIFSPHWIEDLWGLGICILLCVLVVVVRQSVPPTPAGDQS
jgi:hypothetical protein